MAKWVAFMTRAYFLNVKIVRQWPAVLAAGVEQGLFGFFTLACPNLRGAVVEWLETLGYGAESLRKVVRSRPSFLIRRLENLSAQHRMGTFFRIREG